MAKDKTPLTSKKFIAFFFSLVVLASILTITLFTQTFGWSIALFASIGMLAIAFISIGYVLSQGALDKFVAGLGEIKNIAEKKDNNDNPETME